MKIDVTQEDIDKGIPGNSCKCPVALAFRRLVGGVAIGSHWAVIPKVKPLSLPTSAVQFISKFDDAEPVEPFSFEVSL